MLTEVQRLRAAVNLAIDELRYRADRRLKITPEEARRMAGMIERIAQGYDLRHAEHHPPAEGRKDKHDAVPPPRDARA